MKKNKKWFSLSSVYQIALFFSSLYILWRVLFTIPSVSQPLTFALGILLLGIELVGLIEFMVNFKIMSNKKNYPLPSIPERSEERRVGKEC